MTEYIKTKTIHKTIRYIIHETTFEDNVIDKSVNSPNSNKFASTTTSTSPFTSLAKILEAISNKSIKSPK